MVSCPKDAEPDVPAWVEQRHSANRAPAFVAQRHLPLAHVRNLSTDSAAVTATGTTLRAACVSGTSRRAAKSAASFEFQLLSMKNHRAAADFQECRSATGTGPRSHSVRRHWAGREKSRVGGQRVTLAGTFPTAPLRTVRATRRCIRLSRFDTFTDKRDYDVLLTGGPSYAPLWMS